MGISKGNYLVKNKLKKTKRCEICKKAISETNKSGLCQKCNDRTRRKGNPIIV